MCGIMNPPLSEPSSDSTLCPWEPQPCPNKTGKGVYPLSPQQINCPPGAEAVWGQHIYLLAGVHAITAWLDVNCWSSATMTKSYMESSAVIPRKGNSALICWNHEAGLHCHNSRRFAGAAKTASCESWSDMAEEETGESSAASNMLKWGQQCGTWKNHTEAGNKLDFICQLPTENNDMRCQYCAQANWVRGIPPIARHTSRVSAKSWMLNVNSCSV